MNPLTFLLFAVLVGFGVVIVRLCVKRRTVPQLLLACAAAGGIGATWFGLRILFLGASSPWPFVVLIAVGLIVVALSAIAARRVFVSRPSTA